MFARNFEKIINCTIFENFDGNVVMHLFFKDFTKPLGKILEKNRKT